VHAPGQGPGMHYAPAQQQRPGDDRTIGTGSGIHAGLGSQGGAVMEAAPRRILGSVIITSITKPHAVERGCLTALAFCGERDALSSAERWQMLQRQGQLLFSGAFSLDKKLVDSHARPMSVMAVRSSVGRLLSPPLAPFYRAVGCLGQVSGHKAFLGIGTLKRPLGWM